MKIISSILLLFTLSVFLFGCEEKNPVLEIEGGQIQGIESETPGVYVYKGVPFAAPPVGDLRWKAPQPVVPWEGVKLAVEFGNACMQATHLEGQFYTKEFFDEGDAPYSEDCLFLNVPMCRMEDENKTKMMVELQKLLVQTNTYMTEIEEL